MATEVEAIYKGERMLLEISEAIIMLLDNKIENLEVFRHNRAIARLLGEITENGTVHPHYIPYSGSAVGIQRQVEEKIKEFNKNHPNKEKIPYWTNHASNGAIEFWTNAYGEEKIRAFEREVRIQKGGYFAEVTPKDLITPNSNITTISGISEAEIEMLKRRPYPINNNFSFCVTKRDEENDKYDIGIQTDRFMCSPSRDKEDVFSCLVRGRVALNDIGYGEILKKQVEYDKSFEKIVARFNEAQKDEKESIFIAPAKGGGKYFIEITESGYKVYENNNDMLDNQQILRKKENVTFAANGERENSELYLKNLFYDISEYIGDSPVFAKNENDCIEHYLTGQPFENYPLVNSKKHVKTMEFKDVFTKEYCKEIKKMIGETNTFLGLSPTEQKNLIEYCTKNIDKNIEEGKVDGYSKKFQNLLQIKSQKNNIRDFNIKEISTAVNEIINDLQIESRIFKRDDVEKLNGKTNTPYYNRVDSKNDFNDELLKNIKANTFGKEDNEVFNRDTFD